MSNLKKVSAFILCLILVLLCLAPAAFSLSDTSVSISEGLSALRGQFSRGKGPETKGYAIDYSFFSPVKSQNDTQKYPLVVIMAGALEGQYEGKELTANEFANWSSSEFQSRFILAGGAYILIARAPEERMVCWDASALVAPLKAALDDFIVKNPNVDTNRIYAIGWCLGAKGAINLTVNYPGFVDAAIIMVPPFKISDSEAKALTQIPIWLVGCKNDSYARYNLYIEPSWKQLKSAAKNPEKIRLTSFDTAVNGNFFFNHNVWLQFSHDMEYQGNEYSGMKTINGNDTECSAVLGCIRWLSLQGLPKIQLNTSENEDCTCICHSKNVLVRLFWKFSTLLSILLSSKNIAVCECGINHW